MSKAPSLDSAVIVRKGHAMPVASAGAAVATMEPRKEDSLESSKEAIKEVTKETADETPVTVKRKRPWDGQDDVIKVNYEVPERVQTKLQNLKSWKKIRNIKEFVAKSLEQAVDKEIAKAEKEGY